MAFTLGRAVPLLFRKKSCVRRKALTKSLPTRPWEQCGTELDMKGLLLPFMALCLKDSRSFLEMGDTWLWECPLCQANRSLELPCLCRGSIFAAQGSTVSPCGLST